MFLRHIHILVYEMQQVVFVRPGGVSQINHRHIVTVAVLGNAAVVPIQIPLRISC